MDNPLWELFIEELRDLYNAEHYLIQAIPRMAQTARSPEIRSGFEHHLKLTWLHVERLRQIFLTLHEEPPQTSCVGVVRVLQETEEVLREDFAGDVMDEELISAAQRVERHEIAVYECVQSWAEELGEQETSQLLATIVNDKTQNDARLTELAEGLASVLTSDS
jgi:ferritin-like metal-binding protein YciE